MSIKDITDEKLLTETEVLNRMEDALTNQKPFSLVRLGDLENIVLGQYKFISEDKIINCPLHKNNKKIRFSKDGKCYVKLVSKGLTLPNMRMLKQMIEAIRKADVVGVCRYINDEIEAPDKYKRELTNKIFDYYNLRPAYLTYILVSRRIVAYERFWELVHRCRTLLISSYAKEFAEVIKKKYDHLKPNIAGCLNFTDYEQIPATLEKAGKIKFDLALLSAGASAVIMAPELAGRFGKVAIDFGKAMQFMVKPNKRVKPWEP